MAGAVRIICRLLRTGTSMAFLSEKSTVWVAPWISALTVPSPPAVVVKVTLWYREKVMLSSRLPTVSPPDPDEE